MSSDNKLLAKIIKREKYLQPGETEEEGINRRANALADSEDHFQKLQEIFRDDRFLPGGRVMASVGSAKNTTAFNCYVSRTIPDSMDGITDTLKEALQTLRMGGGIGYDFSSLRPNGALITSLNSTSSGPVGNSNHPSSRGFMDMFDAGCATIMSAGHRRGAQMGVLRIDHPDIRHFIRAKRNTERLLNFNISVAVTDEFMSAVKNNESFALRFEGKVYEQVNARNLWDEIMRSTWDWAEPGILFIDRINNKNNLWYCETIAATNPCGEQPLPPHGACLLGSFNLTKYITEDRKFNWTLFREDIPFVVRAMDNVTDRTVFPLPEQEKEAKDKRRMGLGVTGLAHTAEVLGFPYGSEGMLAFTKKVLTALRDTSYQASIDLAKEKGSFPLLDKTKYLQGSYIATLPEHLQEQIHKHGIRNSHLLSIAPTGTISLSAGNISSGIEPPYTVGNYERSVFRPDGSISQFNLRDWAEENYGITPVSSEECSVDNHIDVLNLVSNLVDSSVSKTCNVGPEVTFEEFKNVYMKAYEGGASGCTTFRATGKRGSIFTTKNDTEKDQEDINDNQSEPTTGGSACFIDAHTGQRSCE